MRIEAKQFLLRLAAVGILILAYFVIYPQELAAVLSPVGQFLGLSTAISPWLYAIVGVGVLCWTAVRIWGERPGSRQVPPST